MRVRYKMYGSELYKAECDLSDKQAKKIFKDLQNNPLCLWSELVGEDDDNYMDVIDSYDGDLNLAKNVSMLMEVFG